MRVKGRQIRKVFRGVYQEIVIAAITKGQNIWVQLPDIANTLFMSQFHQGTCYHLYNKVALLHPP